jgi:aminoglycoside phosphotransferase (APT) family kinase protein
MTASSPLDSLILQQALPGLRGAFDEPVMQRYLERALFDPKHTTYLIEACELDQATYVPGPCCILRYSLTLRESTSGQTQVVLVSGRLLPDEASCATYLRDSLMPLAERAAGREELAPFATPVAIIAPLAMVVHAYPLDGELAALLDATNRTRMLAVLRETVPDATSHVSTGEECRVELVDYGRQDRATLRYYLMGSGGDPAQPARLVVYGKLTGDGSGAMAGAVSSALQERVARSVFPFHVPQVFAWQEDTQLVLLEAIPGAPAISDALKARLRGKAADEGTITLEAMIDTCAQIGATLHTSAIHLGPRRTLEDILGSLAQRFSEVERISPDLGGLLSDRLTRLASAAQASSPMPLCFCHGDFTFGQVLFAGAYSGLVDFDSVCRAEPALDLGHFLTYLTLTGEKGKKSDTAEPHELIGQLTERFLATYSAAVGLDIAAQERLRERVAVYKGVSLLRRALRSWQKFKPSRIEAAITLLDTQLAQLP